MDDEEPNPAPELESREPRLGDLVALCRELNAQGARYLVCGGFAIRAAGYARRTGDIDLLIDSSPANEALVYRALEILPDKAVLQLRAGEVSEYTVVRVADEITIDLMHAASGIEYAEASAEAIMHHIDGVEIPFASPQLLWRMKSRTHREKDQFDLAFLRRLFEARGLSIPE